MKIFYPLYILEILSYLVLPRLFFNTDTISYLFLGFCFLLPVSIITLVILKKTYKSNRASIIIQWIFVLLSGVGTLYLLAVYNAASSIGTI